MEIKLPLNESYIETCLGVERIYSAYIPNFRLKKNICSPFRQDKHPSFGFFRTDTTILWIDYATGEKGGWVKALMKLFGTDFKGALARVNEDFQLDLDPDWWEITTGFQAAGQASSFSAGSATKKPTVWHVQVYEWTDHLLSYWKRYHFTIPLLEHFNVYPLKALDIDGQPVFIYEWRTDRFVYAFKYAESWCYKVYTPLASEKKFKWLGSASRDVLQGSNQLAPTDKPLIFTKSLKDVMALRLLGYIAVAPQGEGMVISEPVMAKLKQRFSSIITLFDNELTDMAGIQGARRYEEKYQLPWISLPVASGAKDISDYLFLYGIQQARDILHRLLLPITTK